MAEAGWVPSFKPGDRVCSRRRSAGPDFEVVEVTRPQGATLERARVRNLATGKTAWRAARDLSLA